MEPYTMSALVTVFGSLFAFYLAYRVGLTRAKHKAPPYKHTENKEVLVAVRVHMNMIENMVVYFPILWVATVFSEGFLVGFIASVWLVSRGWYTYVYFHHPKKRQTPFMLSFLCIIITAVIGLHGLIM